MILDWIIKNLKLLALVASICTFLTGQSHLFGDTWMHILTVTGGICSTTVAFFMTPSRDTDSRDRVSDGKRQELNQ